MSATPRFISDLHFGHRRITQFAGEYRGNTTNVDEHDEWIIEQWNSTVGKRDPVYVLGDIAFNKEGLAKSLQLRGQKFLLLGNHDLFDSKVYEQYDWKVIGFKKYRGYWLSHAPIHPEELRGHLNIHGHVHMNTIQDDRYVNVCVEAVNGNPLSIHDIESHQERLK